MIGKWSLGEDHSGGAGGRPRNQARCPGTAILGRDLPADVRWSG